MKPTKYLLLIILCATNILLPAFADSPVWKIEKNGAHFFLGGTVHLLTPDDYPLPSAFETAYQQSDKVIFESDISKMQTPEFQAQMLQRLSYTNGQNLKNNLSASVYQDLHNYCISRGIPIQNLLIFKPGMVSMALTVTELQRLGFIGEGVDSFFNQKAINDNKPVGQLETADQQLTFIETMGHGQEDALIKSTLTEMEALPKIMEATMEAWRKGDLNALEQTASSTMVYDFPQIYEDLIVNRNNAWVPKIEAMINTQEVELVLVGSLHLSGETGLIAQLKSRGYQIEMLAE